MAIIKSYTDLNQSKVLAEILPIESADMVYDFEGDKNFDIYFRNNQPLFEDDICAWSLAALLDVLPNNENIHTNLSKGGYRIPTHEYTNSWFADYEDETNGYNCVTSADNPVDACYKLILKLYERKRL